jgi:Protein of unknown function (DUF3431)
MPRLTCPVPDGCTSRGQESTFPIEGYIIDNYDNLPNTVLFFHSRRFSWHNNVLLDLDSAKPSYISTRRTSREKATSTPAAITNQAAWTISTLTVQKSSGMSKTKKKSRNSTALSGKSYSRRTQCPAPSPSPAGGNSPSRATVSAPASAPNTTTTDPGS